METIKNYTAQQFEIVDATLLTGVTLVYINTNKNGEIRKSATNFNGGVFDLTNDTEDEVFRVWKNVVATFWEVTRSEQRLKEDNSGIDKKLRAGTPSQIIIRSSDGASKCFDLKNSVWKRIGLVPTKSDLEACNRDYKKKLHRAAKASFDAIGFRVDYDKICQKAETDETIAEEVA